MRWPEADHSDVPLEPEPFASCRVDFVRTRLEGRARRSATICNLLGPRAHHDDVPVKPAVPSRHCAD